jgi:hypothetical protein
MRRLALLALPLLLCACGATKIRPEEPGAAAADWHSLRVKAQGQDADATAQLQDELKRTKLFGSFVSGADAPADLVISAIDEKVVGSTTGPFCFNYAFSYLTAGIVPEICDQRYQVDIDVTSPATGRAAQFRAELTQRRFIGLFGLISSAFGDWKFFGPAPGNPVLARGALLDQKTQIDGLMKP